MSQDELAIKFVLDPTQFREELGRLRRDLEDQHRIEMDKLREEKREEIYAPAQPPTTVEIRETVTGLDKDAADKFNQMSEDVNELKRSLGLPAEFDRLTPERLQDMVREAFKSGGFKDILERDPQMAEDIAWIAERGVARYSGIEMGEITGDRQTYGALQKIYDTMMRKQPYGEGRRMRMLKKWIDESQRQLSIGEMVVTEPQTPEEKRAYMSMGHRATQLDLQRLLGEMEKQAGLEFRLPFGEGTRQLDVFAQYVAESMTTGEPITAVLAAEVKASGQQLGGAGGVAAQMGQQIIAVMEHLKGVYNLETDEELRDFLTENRRVKGEEGEAGIIKMVLASFSDVSLDSLKSAVANYLMTTGGDAWKNFYRDMILGDPEEAGIELVTDVTPPELRKDFAVLWDEGRRDVDAYAAATARFMLTQRGMEWTEERLKKYNPNFSRESLDEIRRTLTGAAATQGTEPERIEVVFEALQRLLEGEETGSAHLFIEGVSRALGVTPSQAFRGIGLGTVSVRALRGRIPGFLPGLAEEIVRRSTEEEEEQISQLVGSSLPEIAARREAEQEWAMAEDWDWTRILGDEVTLGEDVIMGSGPSPLDPDLEGMTQEEYRSLSPQQRIRFLQDTVDDYTDLMAEYLREEENQPGAGYEVLTETAATAINVAYQQMRLEEEGVGNIRDLASGLFQTAGIPMEFDPREYLVGMKKVAKGLGMSWESFTDLVEAKNQGGAEKFLQERVGSVMALVGSTIQRRAAEGSLGDWESDALVKLMGGTPHFAALYQESPIMDDEGRIDPITKNRFINEIVKERITAQELKKVLTELDKMLGSPEIRAMVGQHGVTQLYDTAIQIKRQEQATMDLEPAFGGSLNYWT